MAQLVMKVFKWQKYHIFYFVLFSIKCPFYAYIPISDSRKDKNTEENSVRFIITYFCLGPLQARFSQDQGYLGRQIFLI